MGIYNQYNNSPTLIAYCQNIQNSIAFSDTDVQQFCSNYLNISTANTDGLNVWGIILGQSRILQSGGQYLDVFGFDDGVIPPANNYPQNFDWGSFYSGQGAGTVELNDNAYRSLLQLLYSKYASNNTLASLNQIIQNYSAGRGQAYVLETGKMAITYYFDYPLLPYEINLFANTQCLPKPSGVSLSIVIQGSLLE